jgi:hypothetical protein
MKFWILIAVLCLLSCTPMEAVFPAQEIDADGDYVSVTLPCDCGDVLVYVPGSCECFDKKFYPDVAKALDDLYAWAETSGSAKNKKLIGKYETITLTCGCRLHVYIPKSSGCLGKKSPELEKLLGELYRIVKQHEDTDASK